MSEQPKEEIAKNIDRVALLQLTIFVEAFILLGATFWSRVSEVRLVELIDEITTPDLLLGLGAGIALSAVSIFLFWLGKYFKPLGDLRSIVVDQLAPIFCQLTWVDIIILAIVSGFCEEVMFRGVVQQQFGLWWASLFFGLFHCPSLKHMSYGLWALAAGLLLGWLVVYTGSLWPAIVTHAISNLLSLVFLRHAGRQKSVV